MQISRKHFSILGGFLIFMICSSSTFLFGQLVTYICSYYRNLGENVTISQLNIIIPFYAIIEAISVAIAPFLLKNFNEKYNRIISFY